MTYEAVKRLLGTEQLRCKLSLSDNYKVHDRKMPSIKLDEHVFFKNESVELSSTLVGSEAK